MNNTLLSTTFIFFSLLMFGTQTAQSQTYASSTPISDNGIPKTIRLEWDRDNNTGSLPSNNQIAYKLLSAAAKGKINTYWSGDLNIQMTSQELFQKVNDLINSYQMENKTSSRSFSTSAITNLTGFDNLESFEKFCDELHFTLTVESTSVHQLKSLTLSINRESTYNNKEVMLGTFSFREMKNTLVVDIPDSVWNKYISQMKSDLQRSSMD
ncbi:hypothetical protein R9C00_21975 [Flammeovirgaceae bacterium SG7u.111]|nr:hypothetical protein [Flammeovirgaceae bacterium SG7u.132]WPO34372.1 hypothetical protein R9C00_21975 [Flammeovirgaceae bacterium SG7u.111]